MKQYNNTIYLLKIDTPDKRLYKIGSTRGSVVKRVRELQTGCPYEITILERFTSEYGQAVERTLHNRFVVDRTFGEWFSLDIKEEVTFLENCKKLEECHIILNKNNII